MGLTRARTPTSPGASRFDGRDLLTLPDDELRAIRGNDIAMIFQDPLSSLHPFYKVGAQLIEAIAAHRDVSKQAGARARGRAARAWSASPTRAGALDSYPHEFSGGMRQRAMIAMALVNEPQAADRRRADDGARRDRPGADPRAASQRLQRELGMAVVMITHDLGVVAEMADDIAVMYAGRIVERAPTDDDLRRARAPVHVGPARLDPAARRDRATSRLVPIPGRPPSLINRPSGCHFHPRCPYVRAAHTRDRPGARAACRRRPGPPRRLPARAGDAPAAAGRELRGRRAARARPRERVATDAPEARAPDGRAARRGPRPRQALPDHARASSSSARSARCTRSTACRFDVRRGETLGHRRRDGLRQEHDRAR